MTGDFKGKRITVMGLGLLGGAVNDVKFLAENGADLIVTDLKLEGELRASLMQLQEYRGIKYVLGEHRLEDFRNRDYILQPGNVPLDSIYLAEARKNNIPVVESEALLMKYLPEGVQVVGVTGTRGKSTVTHLIYEILRACPEPRRRVHLGGNVKGVSALSLLGEVNPPAGGGDFVVLELDSWALNGLGVVKRSPNIAVFTNFMDDHMNFYKGDRNAYFADKANIYKYQKKDDVLITNAEVRKLIKSANSRIVLVDENVIPSDWVVKMRGEHNRRNAAYAILVARELKIDETIIKKVVTSFAGLPGRLELVRELEGVEWVNDTNGTTPDAVMAALCAYEDKKGKIILISGGADKKLDYTEYVKIVPEYTKALILFKGSASEKIMKELKITCPVRKNSKLKIIEDMSSMSEAVNLAHGLSVKGDVVLLSPGAASFGMFKNEYDRGEQFNEAVKAVL